MSEKTIDEILSEIEYQEMPEANTCDPETIKSLREFHEFMSLRVPFPCTPFDDIAIIQELVHLNKLKG